MTTGTTCVMGWMTEGGAVAAGLCKPTSPGVSTISRELGKIILPLPACLKSIILFLLIKANMSSCSQ